ncbi:MAG: MGMT family protein [Cytophagaceae bacterium]|nr:MGMT family protein [Cytophagaceae bacterium]
MPENPFDDIYEVVKLIPPGRVTSYGTIANYLGSKGGARLVGWAMNACHGLGIPAHRVVNSKGLLTGKVYFGGNRMQELLEAEGVQIRNDQVLDFQKLLWDPAVEL